MARTAVIAGTASATAGAVQRSQMEKAQSAADQQAAQQAAMDSQAQLASMQQQLNSMQPEPAAAPPARPAAAGGDDLISKLQQLGDLKTAGVLDDAEFAAAKAKLLA
jgi:hypothetical protein